MKKSYFMSLLLVVMLILGACGTSSDNNKSTTNNPSEPDVENHEEDGLEEEDSIIEEEDVENQVEENNETDKISSEVPNDEEQSNDKVQEKTKQVDSDAQDFAIQILPEYTLTSEEPGRDSLYLTEDGNIFMRIETAPFNQDDYDYFKENTVTLLESIKADGEEVTEESNLPQGEGLQQVVGYSVKANDHALTGIVFEKNGLLVRLTVFDTLNNEHYNHFLQMGETITTK